MPFTFFTMIKLKKTVSNDSKPSVIPKCLRFLISNVVLFAFHLNSLQMSRWKSHSLFSHEWEVRLDRCHRAHSCISRLVTIIWWKASECSTFFLFLNLSIDLQFPRGFTYSYRSGLWISQVKSFYSSLELKQRLLLGYLWATFTELISQTLWPRIRAKAYVLSKWCTNGIFYHDSELEIAYFVVIDFWVNVLRDLTAVIYSLTHEVVKNVLISYLLFILRTLLSLQHF